MANDCRRAAPTGVHVTGLASAGKQRLVAALSRRLASDALAVSTGQAAPRPGDGTLRVHAETDIEALIEGGLRTASRNDALDADVIVPVDWEPVERSVRRVLEALADRGVSVGAREAGV